MQRPGLVVRTGHAIASIQSTKTETGRFVDVDPIEVLFKALHYHAEMAKMLRSMNLFDFGTFHVTCRPDLELEFTDMYKEWTSPGPSHTFVIHKMPSGKFRIMRYDKDYDSTFTFDMIKHPYTILGFFDTLTQLKAHLENICRGIVRIVHIDSSNHAEYPPNQLTNPNISYYVDRTLYDCGDRAQYCYAQYKLIQTLDSADFEPSSDEESEDDDAMDDQRDKTSKEESLKQEERQYKNPDAQKHIKPEPGSKRARTW